MSVVRGLLPWSHRTRTQADRHESTDRSRRRWRWLAGLTIVGLCVVLTPAVRARVKAVGLMAEVLPSPVHPLRWVTPEPRRSEIRLPQTRADLYQPRGLSRAPGLVLVHGANPEGKDDPRIRDLAAGFARAGRDVLVPQLELRRQRLDLGDLERIRSAVRWLGRQGKVGVVGFSYGAALALVAIGETDKLQDHVAFIASFGTYFDLLHLLQGVTTGVVPSPAGPVAWHTEPGALDLAAEQLAGLLGGDDGTAFIRAWKDQNPEGLGPRPLSLYQLLSNREPARVPALAARIPEPIRDLLASLSPSRVASRIRFPVLALHSRDDPAAPPSESALLVEAVPNPGNHFVEVGIFRHVTPTASPLRRLGDGLRLVRFAGLVLSAQEDVPRL
jgi:pimeloyl-ACP methyl ester carboxylesterase